MKANGFFFKQTIVALAVSAIVTGSAAAGPGPTDQNLDGVSDQRLGRFPQAAVKSGEANRTPMAMRHQVMEAPQELTLDQRPDADTLVQVYDAMRGAGLLDPIIYPQNPDLATLDKAYNYAIATGHIDPSKRNPVIDARRLSGTEVRSPIKAYSDGSDCALAVLSCAGSGTGTVLACMAAAETEAAVPKLDIACGAGVLGTVGSCGLAVSKCVHWATTDFDFAGGTAGTSAYSRNYVQNASCHKNQRVKSIKPYWGGSYYHSTGDIYGFVVECTDGQKWYFGNLTGTSQGAGCAKGYLIQGMDVKSGTVIDSIKIRCDKVWDKAAGDILGKQLGGTGGSPATIACPERAYVSGIKTWLADSPTGDGKNRYIQRIQLNCRSGD